MPTSLHAQLGALQLAVFAAQGWAGLDKWAKLERGVHAHRWHSRYGRHMAQAALAVAALGFYGFKAGTPRAMAASVLFAALAIPLTGMAQSAARA